MPKQIQLSIPKPCHENWDNMSQVEKGRFCGSCQKQVMDFTSMSDTQLVAFFKKKAGEVCGRFLPEQLDKAMAIPKKRIPWVRYFFQFTLPLFLASLKAGAQTVKGQVKATQTEAKDSCIAGGVSQSCHLTFSDTGLLENYLLGKTIAVIDTCYDISLDTMADKSEVITDEATELKWQQTGGLRYESLIGTTTLGFVISTELPGYSPFDRLDDCTPSRGGLLTEPLITIYPNPLLPGQALNLELENIPEDFYLLQLFTQAGTLVFQKDIWINKEVKVLNLPLPKIASGIYFMVLTSRQKKKKFTDKIVIQ